MCSSSLIRAMASSDVLLASVAFDSLSPMRRCCHNSQRSSINCYLLCRTCSCGAAWRRSARKSHTSCLLPEHVSLAEGDRKLPHYWPRRHPLSGSGPLHSLRLGRIIGRQNQSGLSPSSNSSMPKSFRRSVSNYLPATCSCGADWRRSARKSHTSCLALASCLLSEGDGLAHLTLRYRPGEDSICSSRGNQLDRPRSTWPGTLAPVTSDRRSDWLLSEAARDRSTGIISLLPERNHQRRWAPASACMDLVWPFSSLAEARVARSRKGLEGLEKPRDLFLVSSCGGRWTRCP